MTPTAEISDTEMTRVAQVLIDRKEELIGHLRKHRVEEVRAKSKLEHVSIELDQLENEMGRMHRTKTYDFVSSPEWKEDGIDPRDPEGNTSQSWAEIYVERMLRHDEEWNGVLQAFFNKQKELAKLKEEALESQSNVMTFQEMLMANGQEMRLRAAMWQAMDQTNITIHGS